jgi:Domain of unknown function (DUF4419)
MPVTIYPSAHGANESHLRGNSSLPTTVDLNSKRSKPTYSPDGGVIIQSSFPPQSSTSPSTTYSIRHGFPYVAMQAYNLHHHLTIRPDDIWLSILTQFNIYVHTHSEKLRHLFVSHSGTKELSILEWNDILAKRSTGSDYGVEWGAFTFKMTKLIGENITDASLREWMLPTFTTTTKVDQAVAAILMMSALQKYFNYSMDRTRCGLPSVTLLGQKSDWEALAKRAERLVRFGGETETWYGLLKPVLQHFVRSFEEPECEGVKDFWDKIVHESGGSGVTHLSVSLVPCLAKCKLEQFGMGTDRDGRDG